MCPVIYSAVTYEHCNIVMSPYTDLQAVVKLSEYSDYSTDSRFRYRSLAALNAFIAHITIFQIDDNVLITVFPKLCTTYIVILKIADDMWIAVSPWTDSSCTIPYCDKSCAFCVMIFQTANNARMAVSPPHRSPAVLCALHKLQRADNCVPA